MIRQLEILLVEDNPADAQLTRDALKSCNSQSLLHVVKDGVEAMQFLRQADSYTHCARPDLILLDLNLPRKDGREVLSEIKSDANLKRIPVVVLTTSRSDRDVTASYDLHANCYIVKPADVDQFFAVVCSVENFWLTKVTRPQR